MPNQYSKRDDESQEQFEQRIAALKASASKRAKHGKKAAPKRKAAKLNKKAARKAEKIAAARTGEQVTLGPTRQLIIAGIKAGKELIQISKDGNVRESYLRATNGARTKVRNVGVAQLLDLGMIAKGEAVELEGFTQTKFTLTAQ